MNVALSLVVGGLIGIAVGDGFHGRWIRAGIAMSFAVALGLYITPRA